MLRLKHRRLSNAPSRHRIRKKQRDALLLARNIRNVSNAVLLSRVLQDVFGPALVVVVKGRAVWLAGHKD